MCFGNMKKTEEATKTTTNPTWLTNATQDNLASIRNLRDTGYQAYEGPRVADLSGDERAAHGMIRDLASSGNPYTDTSRQAFETVTNTPAQQVTTGRIIDNVPGAGGGGSTADYMNPYLENVLAPQLREVDRASMERQKGSDARAAMGGAFGDARHGFADAEIARENAQLRTDTIGKGYSSAFTDAMTRKESDINRMFDASKTNASLNEQGLLRALQGGNALMGLDKYNTGRTADLAKMLEGAGSTARGIDQAKLDADYGEQQKGQQWQLDIAKLLSGAIGASPKDTTETAEKKAPDNSGFDLLGKILGSAIGAIKPSDRRVKENIRRVGHGDNGLPIYAYNLIGSSVTELGFMADEVEAVHPDAVFDVGGIKMVDYARAVS